MENKPKGNKAMFYAGIVFIIASAILGAMGVIFIGASKFRLLK